jgi:GNAT superfamily N-acetyltransferase
MPLPIHPDYTIRDATAADIAPIVRHRLRMFADMGVAIDTEAVSAAFAAWLGIHLPDGTYRAWLVEHRGHVVAGGGIIALTWPPGPRDLSGRLPIVYNIYTEPAHRRHGLARAIMQAIHAWCLEAGYGTVGLAASDEGRTLYESLGYRESPRPYMFVTLQR